MAPLQSARFDLAFSFQLFMFCSTDFVRGLQKSALPAPVHDNKCIFQILASLPTDPRWHYLPLFDISRCLRVHGSSASSRDPLWIVRSFHSLWRSLCFLYSPDPPCFSPGSGLQQHTSLKRVLQMRTAQRFLVASETIQRQTVGRL